MSEFVVCMVHLEICLAGTVMDNLCPEHLRYTNKPLMVSSTQFITPLSLSTPLVLYLLLSVLWYMRSNVGSFSVNGKRTIICVFAVAQGQWANSLTSERIHWLHIENNNRIKMLEVAESMFTCLNQWYVHVKWLNYQLFTYLSDMSMLSATTC